MKYLILCASALLFLSSCKEDQNPWVPRSVVDSLISAQNPKAKNLAVIHQNDIYYLPVADQPPIRITNTPSQSKRLLSMAHNHKKFAYLNGSAIVIVNETGTELARLNQYSNVKCFDWSMNDETLYILNNNSISYYGPSMNLPEMTFDSYTTSPAPDVYWISVSARGDLAYVFRGRNFTLGYSNYGLVIKPAGGGADVVYQSTYQPLQYAAFSTNDRDLVVGGAISSGYRLNYLLFFSGLKNYPDAEFSSSEYYSTPRYNRKENFMVCGYVSGNSDTLRLSARNMSNLLEKSTTRKDLFNSTGVLYTDWK